MLWSACRIASRLQHLTASFDSLGKQRPRIMWWKTRMPPSLLPAWFEAHRFTIMVLLEV
jgi:hypothetical protein